MSSRSSEVGAVLAALAQRHPDLRPEQTEDAGLEIHTLGEIVIQANGKRIPRSAWRSQRALSLFVYLAVKGASGASKDRLIELFWPEAPLRRAERNFHPTLSYVRSALRGAVEGPVIMTTGGVYHLDPELALRVDVHRFDAEVSRARARKDKAARRRGLARAVESYRGDFMGDRYEPWAEDLRAQLSLRYETALEDLASLFFDERDYSNALRYYKELLDRNPFHEETHSRVMMCYHHLGDRRAIREQFERLRGLLRKELGVDPLPETTALFDSLLVSP